MPQARLLARPMLIVPIDRQIHRRRCGNLQLTGHSDRGQKITGFWKRRRLFANWQSPLAPVISLQKRIRSMRNPPRINHAVIHSLPWQVRLRRFNRLLPIVPVTGIILVAGATCGPESKRGERHLPMLLIVSDIGRLATAVAMLIIPHASTILSPLYTTERP